MSDAPKLVWTRAEAMACAYCWCEFPRPEINSGTPEQYWLGITEQARQECRRVAKRRLLVATALGQVAPLPHPSNLKDDLPAIGEAIGLKAPHRVWKILLGLHQHFLVKEPWK